MWVAMCNNNLTTLYARKEKWQWEDYSTADSGWKAEGWKDKKLPNTEV